MVYTLEQFYKAIPNLNKKYHAKLINSIEDVKLNSNALISSTTEILVYASLGCIDSIVNMMVLYLLKEEWNIDINIILQESSEYKELQQDQTSVFYGLDNTKKLIGLEYEHHKL